MARPFLLFLLFINVGALYAQSLSPTLISPAGTWVETPDVQLSWSLGEMMTNTFESSEGILTQGYEQPWLKFDDTVSTADIIADYSFKIFPNPTAYFVNLERTGVENERLRYQLIDVQGKVRFTAESREPILQIDMRDLPSGIYFISIFGEAGNLYKTIPVQKLR